MLPNRYSKLSYGKFLRLPDGNYNLDILFHRDIVFPYNFTNGIAGDHTIYAEIVVSETFRRFNKLNLPINLTWDYYDITERIAFAYHNSIVYTPHSGSMAFALPDAGNALRIKMFVAPDGTVDTEGCISTLFHEILHAVGFQHKDAGVIKGYRPKYYQPSLNNDDIHGLDVVYGHDTKYKINCNLDTRGEFKLADAYIINDNGKLCYQSPVDKYGYAEFRLRKKFGDTFRLLIIGQKDNMLWYKITKPREFYPSITFDIKDLDKQVNTIEDIQGIDLEG